MKLTLEHSHPLEKCYALTSLQYQGRDHLVVAAEKHNQCLLFDTLGNLVSTIWEGPGGTMSLVPLPGKDGWFLATQEMYSPNDSEQAKIVLVRPGDTGNWTITTIAEIPFAHRFDILRTTHGDYLVICTIKSGHDHKDDWSHPGKVISYKLPEDWAWVDEKSPISFTVIADGLYHNHGYWKGEKDGEEFCVVGSDNGVFKVEPPLSPTESWTVTQLLDEPTSDIAFVDFDGDGKDEIITLSPFHGDTIKIYSFMDEQYRLCYTYPHSVPFVHSLWAGHLEGKPYAIIGHRQGDRDMLAFSYDGGYQVETLLSDVGSTNILQYDREGKHYLLSANREVNTIAFYRIEVQHESV